MNLNQSNIDRALGDTPASFSACMQSTLNHCVEARRAPRKLTARTLILAAALVLFCGAAVAMVSAHGLDWWMNNRWLYIQEFNPDLYARIKTSMQKQIEQTDDQPKNNVTVRVQDAAWLADQAFFAIQAVCDNPDYEMHPEFNFDVDGGLSDDPNTNEEDNHYMHWLWTDKGFGLPEDVMDNPDKKLLVYYGTEVHIGTPQGEVLMGASDAMKVEGNSVLIGLTFERAAYETGPVKAAILRCTDAKGYLTLCYPFETRLFANNEFGGVVDHGCVTFKVKIR